MNNFSNGFINLNLSKNGTSDKFKLRKTLEKVFVASGNFRMTSKVKRSSTQFKIPSEKFQRKLKVKIKINEKSNLIEPLKTK